MPNQGDDKFKKKQTTLYLSPQDQRRIDILKARTGRSQQDIVSRGIAMLFLVYQVQNEALMDDSVNPPRVVRRGIVKAVRAVDGSEEIIRLF